LFGSSNSKKYNKFTHINFVKFFIIFEIIVLLILAVFPQKSVSAKSSSDKFYENTFEIIDELNTEELENLFNENSYYNSIKGNSFKEKLKNLLSQNITEGNFFSSIISNLIINFL